MTLRCRVIARYGSEIDALQPDGSVRRASLRRRVDDVVCGDVVTVDSVGAVVRSREPRRNHLARRDGFNRPRTIAANIDRAWIVVAPRPEIPHLLIDRFLVGIRNLPAEAGIVVNKSDLAFTGDAATSDPDLSNYTHLALPILRVSAHTGLGLEAFRAAAAGGCNVLVGPSGVGKSSLIQALLPAERLRIAEVGQGGEGRHTTTTARWYEAEGGAAWIDSPGVRDFSPEIASVDQLVQGFPDLSEHAADCRFRNCTHRSEPGCAVGAAVDRGLLPAARLEAWRELLASLIAGGRGRG
ncbi:MAG: ribosome small subunit-dependent GTPase A [Thioalkalivibrio sp.]|nr:MAG: ribosome small subunit-dependent GTPase A [Thioalkalivibrio sp.]